MGRRRESRFPLPALAFSRVLLLTHPFPSPLCPVSVQRHAVSPFSLLSPVPGAWHALVLRGIGCELARPGSGLPHPTGARICLISLRSLSLETGLHTIDAHYLGQEGVHSMSKHLVVNPGSDSRTCAKGRRRRRRGAWSTTARFTGTAGTSSFPCPC